MTTGKKAGLLPGTLDVLILKTLTRGSLHGMGFFAVRADDCGHRPHKAKHRRM
jgi:hypothetical protein